MPKIRKKSLIHENADANITCDFGDGDISRSRSRLPHGHIVTSIIVRCISKSMSSHTMPTRLYLLHPLKLSSLFHASVIIARSVSLTSLYCSVGVEDEPRVHDFEMIRSVSLSRLFITILLLGPLPYLGSEHRVFILRVLRSNVSSLFTRSMS